ncbi:MAG: aminotransferase class I/II-fold pyridoxal phosphate-dependent enzyme [Eubacteriales bacterium]
MEMAHRMKRLGKGVFSVLLDKKNEQIRAGREVIDLSVGTPNIPPTEAVMAAISEAAQKPENYIYSIQDLDELRQTVADWYKKRYSVVLKPETEILAAFGTQEALTSAFMPIINPGDLVILPDPAYPAFTAGAAIAGAEVYYLPQREENGYIMDLSEVPENIAKRAKVMVVSYPNNPTAAVAGPDFYRGLIAFAKKYDIFVFHDNAYSELVFDGETCGSFLGFDGAKDVGVEFNSLSKTYGLAGARVGFCVGNAEYIAAFDTFKSNTNFGLFLPVQKGAITALTQDQTCVKATCDAYQARRDCIIEAFGKIGWPIRKTQGSMFVWAKCPKGYQDSFAFAMELVEKAGVLVVPGISFGPSGEGHVRIALVADEADIWRAAERIEKSGMLK